MSPVVQQAFSRYPWPGNVRELENACERIVQTCTCGTVGVGCMAASVLFGAAAADGPSLELRTAAPPRPVSLDDRLKEVESNLIAWALKATDGNKSRAAELLSIKRSTLGDRIARCGLVEPPRAAPATARPPVPKPGASPHAATLARPSATRPI
jgi:DNA-binding NtrC family response regulator